MLERLKDPSSAADEREIRNGIEVGTPLHGRGRRLEPHAHQR